MSRIPLQRYTCDHPACDATQDVHLSAGGCVRRPHGWFLIEVQGNRGNTTLHYCGRHMGEVLLALPGLTDVDYQTLEDLSDGTQVGPMPAGEEHNHG